MTDYLPKKQLSTIARMHAALKHAEDRKADREDEYNRAVRRVRAELVALNQVDAIADREWHAENDPVHAPVAVGRGFVHPSRQAALAAFTALWPSDPLLPIVPMLTKAQHVANAQRETVARIEAAKADLAQMEAERVGLPAPTRTVTGQDAAQALADRTMIDVEPVPERRGRGRPARVLLDPDAAVVS